MAKNNIDQGTIFFALPQELAQTIATYLATKPYNEVVTMMNQLSQLQSIVYKTDTPQPTQSQAPVTPPASNTESIPGQTE